MQFSIIFEHWGGEWNRYKRHPLYIDVYDCILLKLNGSLPNNRSAGDTIDASHDRDGTGVGWMVTVTGMLVTSTASLTSRSGSSVAGTGGIMVQWNLDLTNLNLTNSRFNERLGCFQTLC